MEPDEILKEYGNALRGLLGDEIAEKSEQYYSEGWYYLNRANKFPDGSCGTVGPALCHRKRQVIAMTEELLARSTKGMNC